ncbi:putative translation initiation factor eIF-2B subunit beta [Escovopsis weberi]|uniref:Translation initiation factor eIF2B subunit beta n=1 Tax=Escovopsis weberi TaxID=150374 RepID=A0A0M8N1E8_ESCWE|nr:putative translation initiation factor eIF-2B subunit beta [Escovopsis weberi]
MPSATGHAPDLEKFTKSLKGQPLEASVECLISLLKRRQIKGPEPCAIATAHILLQVVAKSKWNDVDGLLNNVSKTGRRLLEAVPNELVVGNIVRRVLGLIRDEASEDRNDGGDDTASEAPTPTTELPPTGLAQHWPAVSSFARRDRDGPGTGTGTGSIASSTTAASPRIRPGLVSSYSSVSVAKSLFHLLSASPPTDGDVSPFRTSGASTPTWRGNTSQVHALRSEVINGIEEIMDEIGQVDDQIAAAADAQIHPGDYVLVHQPSPTVERFVLRAAQKRSFTVLISVAPPRGRHPDVGPTQHAAFRKKLAAAGVPALNVANSGLTAYMSRVNKVIIGAHAIVANGGVLADAGAAAIARAASEQGRAVFALGGIYKLSPETPFDESSLIEWGDSSTFVSFADGPMVSGVEIRTALTELVPAELIDTYITNLGAHVRDHLSSLITDHYKQEDADFHIWNDDE